MKDADGAYRNDELPFDDAVARRADRFAAIVASHRPDVVVVDRHPYGLAGELRPGLAAARAAGAATVLGLRDILDEPSVVAAELAGDGWRDVADTLRRGARLRRARAVRPRRRVRAAADPRVLRVGRRAGSPGVASTGCSS